MRSGVRAALALVVVVPLAACSAPTTRVRPNSAPTTPAEALALTTPVSSAPPVSAPPARTAPAPSTSAVAPATTAAAPQPVDCATVPVRFSAPASRRVVASKADAGFDAEVALDVTVTNAGSVACRTSGWATVVYRGDACVVINAPCDPAVDIAGKVERTGTPEPVTIAAQETTTFSLVWQGGTLCFGTPAGIDVTLPGDTRAVRLAPVNLCTAGDDGTPVRATPLGTVRQYTTTGS